jgi:hypothetical protein
MFLCLLVSQCLMFLCLLVSQCLMLLFARVRHCDTSDHMNTIHWDTSERRNIRHFVTSEQMNTKHWDTSEQRNTTFACIPMFYVPLFYCIPMSCVSLFASIPMSCVATSCVPVFFPVIPRLPGIIYWHSMILSGYSEFISLCWNLPQNIRKNLLKMRQSFGYVNFQSNGILTFTSSRCWPHTFCTILQYFLFRLLNVRMRFKRSLFFTYLFF